ncbi:NUDIX hydrolase [Pelotomaculum propionicicum]|uniref:Putative Nudix hydrolase NudL n=1 Tax=Pelotomaculum propionicicum TaxID=258475 RepID=A0A4Y7RN52_9FIRM|nr:CoA pyrophosphatase [Pelotomaculum propionicicum]TEB10293.1 putative Nudix hydrolase NudL [Pelotomaculum propionicicum]
MNDLKRFLTNRQPGIQNEGEYFVSAVLLPLINRNNKCHVLFEVRASHLRRQPGEICFPGGGVEGDELSRPQNTAVREAVEELGLDKTQIDLLGPLDYLVAPHGTLVYPFVGHINNGAIIAPNKAEVEEIFMAPVEYFFNNPPAQSSVEVATRYGRDFPYDRVPATYKKGWGRKWSLPVYYYEYEGHFIWGITARILYNFIKVYYNIKKVR